MFVVMNRVEVADGDTDRFEQVFSSSMEETLKDAPGLVRSQLMRPATPGLPCVSTMEFVDEDAFCDWSRSDAFRRAHRTDVGPPSIGASAIETYSAVTETTSG